MHEMSLCEGIRRIAEEQARIHAAGRVTRISLDIGRFAGVEKDALAFAFDVVMRGSVAEGAELVMFDVPGQAMCFDCAHPVEIENRLDPCPDCGGGKLIPTGGTEMRVRDLEVM